MLSNGDRAKVDAYWRLIANVYELAAVSRRDSESIARQKSVTVTQWHTMSVLSGGDATAPHVAERLGVTRQAVQRVADQLLKSGHLERVRNPQHDTSPLLHLTGVGEKVLAELWAISDAPRAAMLAAIDTGHLHAATTVLHELLLALRKPET